ncbi:hypothetical protein GCM10023149_25080 [Mucilaginibacter gynuensis]|uniref:Endosialidase-like protein n=1 Tax=Mucilaginibacter gynuensis TaxID=1302236 RepID=A0ABP8GGK0_9SPHI
MYKRIIPIAVLFSLIISASKAQENKTIDQAVPEHALTHAGEIVGRLRPVILNYGKTKPVLKFGLDITATKETLPEIITNVPVWKTRGKNNYYSVNEPALDVQQLVSILTAALQEQMTKLTALTMEVEQLKNEIDAAQNPTTKLK